MRPSGRSEVCPDVHLCLIFDHLCITTALFWPNLYHLDLSRHGTTSSERHSVAVPAIPGAFQQDRAATATALPHCAAHLAGREGGREKDCCREKKRDAFHDILPLKTCRQLAGDRFFKYGSSCILPELVNIFHTQSGLGAHCGARRWNEQRLFVQPSGD